MPAGFEVYEDSPGKLRVSFGDRLFRFLGDPIIANPGDSGVITNDGLLTGTPDWVANMYSSNGISFWPGESLRPPNVWFSGNQMFYSIPADIGTQIIQYGVS